MKSLPPNMIFLVKQPIYLQLLYGTVTDTDMHAVTLTTGRTSDTVCVCLYFICVYLILPH